jgi:hypothetical protein
MRMASQILPLLSGEAVQGYGYGETSSNDSIGDLHVNRSHGNKTAEMYLSLQTAIFDR